MRKIFNSGMWFMAMLLVVSLTGCGGGNGGGGGVDLLARSARERTACLLETAGRPCSG